MGLKPSWCQGMDGNICLHSGRVLAEPYEDVCEVCIAVGGLAKKEKPVPCKYMADTGVKVPDRPCKGTYIDCLNPDATVDRWFSCWCNPLKCKFYTAENSSQ